MAPRKPKPLYLLWIIAAYLLFASPAMATSPTQAQIDLLNKGTLASRDGRLEDAQRHYRAAIALGSLNMAHLGLGRTLQKAGGCRDALAEYNTARNAPS